ncbi:aldehyde dehydrogenase (NADP(+)) [Kocuria sp. HSID16901]|uniref:aldehyde dehydrogenase (NADP(+)) n=1 Tax=Kocuria sp. HSID16901 TaxID=2419505 RepID=UPI00065FAACC|nr:aldehyde dehydrogenase (NADP(+)) [Kocuria sp. HSID16901]MCT1366929.1 aldehyde dehydrogenase (NADP(+)) [Rothia sp. p3-SID1597]RUQ20066.1 aldehyde dehydrogenase (NADP(+)) [Kocuria sp. HSID16901]
MTITLTGTSLINGRSTPGAGATTRAINPATEEPLDPAYSLVDAAQLDEATSAAEEAFPSYSALPPTQRADFLDAVAAGIEDAREAIVDRARSETGLTEARLNGEVSRTAGQLRLFATVVRSGSHHRVRVDPALPDRSPAPRVDIRQRMIPLGPVAVFGASNFPLAFSTAGGDTASALAAGCPVVFKAHNAHPGTAELVGRAIIDAAEAHGIHPGVFSLVYGTGAEIGQRLVADPAIHAVGFTGSRSGGLAIARTAFERETPIPVYAEMSSINPVFVFPGALDNPQPLAEAFVGSVTGSAGQLCTEPGIIFVPEGSAGDDFIAAAASGIDQSVGQTMLTPSIARSWHDGVERLAAQNGVTIAARGTDGEGLNAPGPVLFEADLDTFLTNGNLQQEIFGATSLVIRYSSPDRLAEAAAGLEGQLTATIHAAASDHSDVVSLLPRLEGIAGRILYGGWPTGVEVGHAMVHGGPFPATSDSRTTSVGTLAIERFLRPVAYQSFPQDLLPEPARDDNPWNATQSIDGQ